jgi:transcriptional regulator with XRE-family HTH domain
MEPIGSKLKTLRTQAGLTQGQVAKQLNISIPAYSKMEIGITDISLSRIEQLAKIYNLQVKDLLLSEADLKPNPIIEELEKVKRKLAEKEAELNELQRKIIDLHNELKNRN